MTGKIIGKRVVPDVFEVYEKESQTNNVEFSVSKINDGVNFEELKGYAHVDFESGRTDRVLLNKTVLEDTIVYELEIKSALTQEEGRHRIQLSFEKSDLTVVYKTCIFTFVVCESINGNLAYENVTPSVVNDLEEKMEQTLLACNNLKDETAELKEQASQMVSNVESSKLDVENAKNQCYIAKDDVTTNKELVFNMKEETYQYKQDALKISNDTKEFYESIKGKCVTSVNSKTGDVILTADDFGGAFTPTLKPLYIDGAMYDGKTELNVTTDKNYQVISGEVYDLHLENKTCVCIKNLSCLNLYSDKLENLDVCNSEIYLDVKNEIQFYSSTKFYFHGDSCCSGAFMPAKGSYHLKVFSAEKNAKIYVEVKALDSKKLDTMLKAGFPVTAHYSDEMSHISHVVIKGNTATEIVNGVETFAYPVRGVGEPVQDENGNTKYKIDIVTQNKNLLCLPDCSDATDYYCLTYNVFDGFFILTGTAYVEYESVFKLSWPIKKGSTVYLNAFSLMNNIVTQLTSGNVIEFALSNGTTDIVKVGLDYLGNPSTVDGYSNTATLTEDATHIKIKFLERTIGTELNNYVGIAISIDEPMQEFERNETRVSSIYLDSPILKEGNYCDILYMNNGYVSKSVNFVTIESKSELEPLNTSEDAPAIKRFSSNFPTVCSYNKPIWIYGKTIDESSQCVNVTHSYLEFKKDVFGSYDNFDESVFPLRLLYYTPTKNVDIKMLPAIKVFSGATTFYINGGEQPSGGSVLNIKKSD